MTVSHTCHQGQRQCETEFALTGGHCRVFASKTQTSGRKMRLLKVERNRRAYFIISPLFFRSHNHSQIIDECNTQVGKMRQMEELILVSQTLEFDKLKVNTHIHTHKMNVCMIFICQLLSWTFILKKDKMFLSSSGHPDHLPDTIFGEEGRTAGNVQRRNSVQHEGEVYPRLPLPLQ